MVRNATGKTPLLFVKLAPDGFERQEDLKNVINVVEEFADGVIVSNTTISRPDTLCAIGISISLLYYKDEASQTCGLSGAPLKDASTNLLKRIYTLTNGKLFLIGVGGIMNADDAYEKIINGASVVQVYTGMIYRGPALVKEITQGVLERLQRDGFHSVSDAVGSAIK